MNCTICQKPIILVPSASERAQKSGGKPSDYTNKFTEHSACVLRKRDEDTRQLMRDITTRRQAERVTYPLTTSAS